ncbi:MAG: (Fe-S)-binding protein [Anaerolineae bacterium]|nr:(Fe-S)-binding protein [Anaerolineae bacterium]
MLSLPEKVVFVILAIISLYLTWHSFGQVAAVIRRGNGALHLNGLARRILQALEVTITQRTVLNARPFTSILHATIAWGFLFYLLVNLGDVLEGFLADYAFPGTNGLADAYRLLADVLSVAVILSMLYFLVRRFIAGDPRLTFRPDILLHPDIAAGGIRRDSAIVGAFILGHVGARFLGQALTVARHGPDAFQPFASAISGLFSGGNPALLEVGEHVMFWLAIGLILVFVPWFPRTKHFHLLLAPVNYLTRPERRSPGAMPPLPLDDETIESFGAERIEHLSRTQIVDAYACIMCNRCQDVCPAYAAGTPLSPAALEVNKRYFLREHGALLAAGKESPVTLFESALPPEGVWACTACAACVEICPVGNEPLADILAMRQHLVLMEGRPPDRLVGALTRAERAGDPWGHPRGTRLDWAAGLDVPLLADRHSVDVLYWVGCAGAYDPAGQRVSRAMIQIFRAAGVDFAVLGEEERCTCEWARRSGQEALYQQATAALIDTFNRYTFNLIVTQCPHCYHTFRNEYPDFGGHYAVIHHSAYIAGLLRAGRLSLQKWDRRRRKGVITYHDPCFLGRYNGEYDAPRETLLALESVTLAEMPRHRQRSLCCGGGGAQVWMETRQERPINAMRLAEAAATGAQTVVTACPFCAIMLHSAVDSTGKPVPDGDASVRVNDIAELVAGRLSP